MKYVVDGRAALQFVALGFRREWTTEIFCGFLFYLTQQNARAAAAVAIDIPKSSTVDDEWNRPTIKYKKKKKSWLDPSPQEEEEEEEAASLPPPPLHAQK